MVEPGVGWRESRCVSLSIACATKADNLGDNALDVLSTSCARRCGRPVKKKTPGVAARCLLENAVCENYFNEPAIVLKVPLSDVPTPFTAAMMAIAMPVAISPYSIAVAPDSFFKNLTIKAFMAALPSVVMPFGTGSSCSGTGTTTVKSKVA